MHRITIVIAAYAVVSFVMFLVMWRDKRAASRSGGASHSRTPEATLHMLELLGGWPGTLLAQKLLRHKTRKRSYIAVLWSIIVLHTAAWGAMVYLTMQE